MKIFFSKLIKVISIFSTFYTNEVIRSYNYSELKKLGRKGGGGGGGGGKVEHRDNNNPTATSYYTILKVSHLQSSILLEEKTFKNVKN